MFWKIHKLYRNVHNLCKMHDILDSNCNANVRVENYRPEIVFGENLCYQGQTSISYMEMFLSGKLIPRKTGSLEVE